MKWDLASTGTAQNRTKLLFGQSNWLRPQNFRNLAILFTMARNVPKTNKIGEKITIGHPIPSIGSAEHFSRLSRSHLVPIWDANIPFRQINTVLSKHVNVFTFQFFCYPDVTPETIWNRKAEWHLNRHMTMACYNPNLFGRSSYMRVSWNGGTPKSQIIHFDWMFYYKPSNPHLWKPPHVHTLSIHYNFLIFDKKYQYQRIGNRFGVRCNWFGMGKYTNSSFSPHFFW